MSQAGRREHDEWDAHQKLAITVIEDAMRWAGYLDKPKPTTRLEGLREHVDALHWILSDGVGLRFWCRAAGLDVVAFHERLIVEGAPERLRVAENRYRRRLCALKRRRAHEKTT